MMRMTIRKAIEIGVTNINGFTRRRSFLSAYSAIHPDHIAHTVQPHWKVPGSNPLEPLTLNGNRKEEFWAYKRGLSVEANTNPGAEQSPNSDENEKREEKESDKENVKDDQTRVLQAALAHVPKLGWTEPAMVAGARDVGLSPSIVGVFPRKEAALVEYFMDDCLQRLLDEIASREEELSNMVLHDRIARLTRIRLEMQAPYISKWAQALSIQAIPLNVPTSFKQRAALVDEIWHAAGDRSTDIDWYAKRTLLAGIYTASELYMLTDYSPEFRDTWTFLDLRIRDAFDCRKTAQEATQLVATIAAGLGNTLQAFFRRQ